ncbi:hypothetical protein KFZ56_16005 [Virgibacillus sp. NKC19-3]|uniref:hypothetical protein n=1 Tax=Virgibacillus saliphilus TaxID=2831674 RepID=UPI001C9B2B2B|nr:hypothetical protein [Virgibacillus sp. NKC19-3]MBY7144528.1 hypothetical protein [Virgibacillus sp. NKC19-3]
MSLAKTSSVKDEQKKMSPQEKNVLKRYGVIEKSNKKKRARTINELYEQRYKVKNH